MVWLSKIFGMIWNGGSRIFVNICFWYKKGYEALLVLATLWCRLSETNMHQSKSATRHLKLKSKPAPATTCTLFVLGRTAANLSPHRTVHCRTKEGYSDDTFSRRNTHLHTSKQPFFFSKGNWSSWWLRGVPIQGFEPCITGKAEPGTVSLIIPCRARQSTSCTKQWTTWLLRRARNKLKLRQRQRESQDDRMLPILPVYMYALSITAYYQQEKS